MLVAAGLEHRPRGDRRRVRGRVPRRRGAGQPPARPRVPAGDRAHPGDARPRRAAGGCRPRLRCARGQRVLRGRVVPGLRRLSGNTLDALRAGHRGEVEPDKRDPADFALWKAAGEGRLLKLAEPAGRGLPGLASRVLGDGTPHLGRFDIHTGGIDNVFPHHEDEIAQSAPIVGGPPARLGARRAPAHGRPKMAKSAGSFQRSRTRRNGASIRWRSATCADVALRAETELHATSRWRGAAAGLTSLRAQLAGAGPAAGGGPWEAPTRAPAGAARRPTGVGAGQHRRRRCRSPSHGPGRCPTAPLSARRVARSTTGSWRPSTTTWTCPARCRSFARCSEPTFRRRAPLAGARRGPRPGAGPGPSLGRGGRAKSRTPSSRRRPRGHCSTRSRRRRDPPATSSAPTRCATGLPNAWAWDVVDSPEGSDIASPLNAGLASGSIGRGQREPELPGECRHVLPIVVARLVVRVERELQLGCRAADLPSGDLPVGVEAPRWVVEHFPGQPGLQAGSG